VHWVTCGLRRAQVLAAQAEGRDSARMLAPADTAYLRALVAAQAPPPPPDGWTQLLAGAAVGAPIGAPGSLGVDVWPQAPRASAWRGGPARAPGYGAAPGFPGFPAAPVLPEWPDEALLGAADGRRLFPAGGSGASLPGAPPARGAQAAGGACGAGACCPDAGPDPAPAGGAPCGAPAATRAGSSLDHAREIMHRPAPAAAGAGWGGPPAAALAAYRPETVAVRLAARLFGPELPRLPTALCVGLARWLQASPHSVDVCARARSALLLQARHRPAARCEPDSALTRCAGAVKCSAPGVPGQRHQRGAPSRPLRSSFAGDAA